jgi:hypothetical protein
MALSAGERVMRGRIAAYSRWSRTANRTEATVHLRAGFDRRFEAEIDLLDPDHRLTPETRAKMIESARRAYFVKLAFASAKTRRKKEARRRITDPRAEGEGADAAGLRAET